MIKIDVTKLSPETRAALTKFGRAAARYHSGKYHKKEFMTVGNDRVLTTRIVPRSVEEDYFNTKQALLQRQDKEIRPILDKIDTTRVLDSIEGTSAQVHTEVYYATVKLEKYLVLFAGKLPF